MVLSWIWGYIMKVIFRVMKCSRNFWELSGILIGKIFFYMIIDKCKLKFNIGLLLYFWIKFGLFFFFYMVVVLYLY